MTDRHAIVRTMSRPALLVLFLLDIPVSTASGEWGGGNYHIFN